MLEPLCRPLYAWGRVKGAEPRQRIQLITFFATLAWFVSNSASSSFSVCHQVIASSPSLQSFASLPPPPRDASRSQDKVRSSSRTRFSSLFYSFSNSASSFVSLFPLSHSNPSSLLEPRPHPLYACRRVSRASAS